jgi:glycosyltransferase involved in cell wall biosynthesis
MRRHIVLIAPPWYPVPPHGYGGIELVVALLADGLRAAGHQVTLFGAEGSAPDAIVEAPRTWAADLGGPDERLRQLTYAVRILDQLRGVGPVDVIHDHSGFATLLAATVLDTAPVVHTVHGSIREPDRTFYESLGQRTSLVAISDSQRRTAVDLGWLGTVHNAVDDRQLQIASRSDKEPYLLCLARICPDKGQHLAIEVAERTGMRLVLAGKIEPTPLGLEYYQRHIAPAVDGDRVAHLHNVSGAGKARLLARATALLAPLQWDEPFGLAMVEAMASGTPVVALARGAATELVSEGDTGYVVDDVDQMVAATLRVSDIEPQTCAQLTRSRFSPRMMTDGYLWVYERAIEHRAPPAGVTTETAHAA